MKVTLPLIQKVPPDLTALHCGCYAHEQNRTSTLSPRAIVAALEADIVANVAIDDTRTTTIKTERTAIMVGKPRPAGHESAMRDQVSKRCVH
jgi:hypothetical protein